MSVCDYCYEEGCFGYNNLSCPCSKACHEADEKKANDDAEKIQQLELQNDEWKVALKVANEQLVDANRLNGEMRDLLAQFAEKSTECKHLFKSGSQHVVPDDCVYLCCSAKTLLSRTEKRICTGDMKCPLSGHYHPQDPDLDEQT